jgi:hypothetical protein
MCHDSHRRLKPPATRTKPCGLYPAGFSAGLVRVARHLSAGDQRPTRQKGSVSNFAMTLAAGPATLALPRRRGQTSNMGLRV